MQFPVGTAIPDADPFIGFFFRRTVIKDAVLFQAGEPVGNILKDIQLFFAFEWNALADECSGSGDFVFHGKFFSINRFR